MVQRRLTLMDPAIEDLLDKVDSKFTLVALSAKRARQINSYYNQLGEGLGMVVPPQVPSVSGKPLTIAFEEISAGKATYHRLEPGEEDAVVIEGGLSTEAAAALLSATDAAAAAAALLSPAPDAAALLSPAPGADDAALDTPDAEPPSETPAEP